MIEITATSITLELRWTDIRRRLNSIRRKLEISDEDLKTLARYALEALDESFIDELDYQVSSFLEDQRQMEE